MCVQSQMKFVETKRSWNSVGHGGTPSSKRILEIALWLGLSCSDLLGISRYHR